MVYGKPVSTKMVAKWKTFTQVGLVYALFIYINIELRYRPDSLTNSDIAFPGFKLFIDNYLLFVTAFTVITGVIYLVDNWRPVKILFWGAYRAIISFRLISEIRKSARIGLSPEMSSKPIEQKDSSISPAITRENGIKNSLKSNNKSKKGDQQNSAKSAAP